MLAYRLLTGDDSAAFCHRITEALSKGWSLYGSPSCSFDPASGSLRCAQAVTKEVAGPYDPGCHLGDL